MHAIIYLWDEFLPQENRKVNEKAGEIHPSMNTGLNTELPGTFATEVYRCRA